MKFVENIFFNKWYKDYIKVHYKILFVTRKTICMLFIEIDICHHFTWTKHCLI